MGLFDDMLKEGESLFKNEDALDYEFVPKLLPFREDKQHTIAACIKPLLNDRNGRNAFVYGDPGIGKTAATRWVLKDLEETTDEIIPLYINCWQKNTTFKIFVEICQQLGYAFTQNKNTEDLFKIIKQHTVARPAIFVFDEVDKAEDLDFLYVILNEIYKKSVILITNYKNWFDGVEDRIKSRLTPELIEFKGYDPQQTKEILKNRVSLAFAPGSVQADAFNAIAEKAAAVHDVRMGLYLLREAGLAAEDSASKKITLDHANTAIGKLADFTQKATSDLDDDAQNVLKIIKANSGKKIGDLFKIYQEADGKGSYKTFQRRIEKLTKGKYITSDKITGGKEGTTTIVSANKKLDDF